MLFKSLGFIGENVRFWDGGCCVVLDGEEFAKDFFGVFKTFGGEIDKMLSSSLLGVRLRPINFEEL